MGFLSKIGGAVKNVFKGIVSVFEPILKPLGKLMNSKFGKALMIGLSIFTLGTAMVAGYAAFGATTAAQAAGTATGGFISAFVQGGKEFMLSMVGKGTQQAVGKGAETAIKAGEGVMQTGETLGALEGGAAGMIEGAATAATPGSAIAQGGGALSEASTMAAQSPGMGAGAGQAVQGAGGMGGMPNLPEAPGAAEKVAELTSTTGAQDAAAGGGWLNKAKDAAQGFIDYSKTEGGSNVVGSLIQGVGNYYTEKDRQEFEDRIRKQWGKGTKDRGIRDIRGQSARVGRLDSPNAQGIASASRDTATTAGGRPTFNRAYGAGAPQPAGG